MANAEDDPAAAAARELARARWGNTAVIRAAETVIARARELDTGTREQLHEATAPAGETDPP